MKSINHQQSLEQFFSRPPALKKLHQSVCELILGLMYTAAHYILDIFTLTPIARIPTHHDKLANPVNKVRPR